MYRPLGGRTPILILDFGGEKHHLEFVAYEIVERMPNRGNGLIPCLTLRRTHRKEDDSMEYAYGKRGECRRLPWSNISEEREKDRNHRDPGTSKDELQILQKSSHARDYRLSLNPDALNFAEIDVIVSPVIETGGLGVGVSGHDCAIFDAVSIATRSGRSLWGATTEGLKTTEAALARTLRAMDAVRADRLPWPFTGCAAATELLRLRIHQVKKASD